MDKFMPYAYENISHLRNHVLNRLNKRAEADHTQQQIPKCTKPTSGDKSLINSSPNQFKYVVFVVQLVVVVSLLVNTRSLLVETRKYFRINRSLSSFTCDWKFIINTLPQMAYRIWPQHLRLFLCFLCVCVCVCCSTYFNVPLTTKQKNMLHIQTQSKIL